MQVNEQAPNRTGNANPPVIRIELLALDLNSCTRCTGTLDNIEKAIEVVRPVLEVMEVQVNLERIVVESEEQARRHEFSTSPTVRIDGEDIAFEAIESECDACTDLCGCDEGTNCRVWPYRGKEYTEAPVGLVVESILRTIFAAAHEPRDDAREYGGTPENLRRFFETKLNTGAAAKPCCPPSEQEICCEPSQKTACCETTETEACGCR